MSKLISDPYKSELINYTCIILRGLCIYDWKSETHYHDRKISEHQNNVRSFQKKVIYNTFWGFHSLEYKHTWRRLEILF